MIRAASFLVLLGFAAAETGIDAWLRYAPLPGASSMNISFPSSIVALNSSNASPVYSAGQELQKGIQSILGKNLTISSSGASTSSAIVVGQIDEYTGTYGSLANPPALLEDGYWLSVQGSTVQILGHNERGALYGTFQYLRMLAQGNFSNVAYMSNPAAPVRWVNQWDNLDGSITRGYGGPSIFFNNGTVVDDLTRASQYGRILASIGLNGLIVNNVNANSSLLSDVNMAGLGRIADVFRPWGVRIGISQDFAAPQDFGNLSTYDPVDPSVVAWWQNTTDNLYKHVPDMCGYLVKADSE
jgi:alpha-glucuronidase